MCQYSTMNSGRIIKHSLCLLFAISVLQSKAGNKIKIYFNHPVDNGVSTGINAVDAGGSVADTIVAYINRSKYTIDIAQYDYNQSSYANIATAINNAFSRGVSVRWIYDGSSSNTGLTLLNGGIHTLGSPTSSAYSIMHNKFVVIDANSTDPSDATVITGSFDWSSEQFNTDYNNAVILQDSAIAHAYTAEFNMMWGDTGQAPNISASKFGPFKTDLGRHSFTIDGHNVELYFSPSDGTNTHIQGAISSANTDLYFGMYTFTDNSDATLIVSKHTGGVYVAGIDDSYSNSYSPHGTFTSGLGSNFKVYSGVGIYHNKFMIVDPSDICSDPQVLTGSHNWSVSANTTNDENTIIIHDDTSANIYYQSFHADFAGMGGTLSTIPGCVTAVQTAANTENELAAFPNPSNGTVTISYQLPVSQKMTIALYTITGQKIATVADGETQAAGRYNYELKIAQAGMYFVCMDSEQGRFMRRLVVAQ